MVDVPTKKFCILTWPQSVSDDEPTVYGILISPQPLTHTAWMAVQLNIEETFADCETGETLAQVICTCYPEFQFMKAYRDTAVRHIDTNKRYALA